MDEDLFKIMFEAQAKSPTLRDVWRHAYADDYPEDADPLSFVTCSDLRGISEALGQEVGQDMADIGCGAGGPGAHVAKTSEARLTGVDSSPGALGIARNRHLGGLPEGSRFQQGEFASTGLPDAFAHGVMSTDALLFADDPAAAFREIARVMKPRGRLAFTSFELKTRSESLRTGPIIDYRPSLESAGFIIETYEETPDWEDRMRNVFSGILDRREELTRELGEPAAPLTFAWATLRPPELSESRRILAVAQRP
ncbi:MAG: class I SAM-dependent methyltransferase [bacterium]|nr:class I SAM-dependent methyltransferase [bacterium]